MWGDLGGARAEFLRAPLRRERPRVSTPQAGFAPVVFVLLPLCPLVSATPRARGQQGAAAPEQAPWVQGTGPASSSPPAPLAMGIGAGGGAGSLSGLALGVRVPSLSLASSLSISFSFE